jgi:hypothetical protein
MRLQNFLNELSSDYGKGITFIDLDETIFKTFSKIYVLKDNKITKKLTNQEFNSYKLEPGEKFNFGEFRSAEIFRKTAIPIPQTVNRIKRMIKNIDKRESKIMILTARTDFDNKKEFLNTFRDHNIPIDNMYVERAGNVKDGSTAQKKKKIILKYLKSGDYRRVRLIDDHLANIKEFLTIKHTIPQTILDRVKDKHNIQDDEQLPIISFYGLLVLPSGKLKEIK